MPVDLCTVDRVFQMPAAKGLTRYDIGATITAVHLRVVYETVDPWIASLCERAKDTEQACAVTWKDSRFGRQIVQIRLLRDEDSAFHRQLSVDRRTP